MMNEPNLVDLDPLWDSIEKGITRLLYIIEEQSETKFSAEEYMAVYTAIYDLSYERDREEHVKQLFVKYQEIYEKHFTSVVLPSLREKHDEFMLREFLKRWSNHKVMVKWLSKLFRSLNHYQALHVFPNFSKDTLSCFRVVVYKELYEKVRDAVISVINKDREGEKIDSALLKNIFDVFDEVGTVEMDYKNFEKAMLNDTAAYYKRKASCWIVEKTCPKYMLKAEDCLRREKDRVDHYLHSSTETKLLQKVQEELLTNYATKLLENEHSGCHALLKDGKLEDLSRMYKLFSKIRIGLELAANIFKEHVTSELIALVKQAEDASSTERVVFVGKVIELRVKFMLYVNSCFQNHGLFYKAFIDAFEILCNKSVAGIAEHLATFCDDILRKGWSGRLNERAIEETLKNVLKLFADISDKDLFAEFYRKKLAYRLVDESVNCEQEMSMLTKLKQQCDADFTFIMEKMVTEVILSKETQVGFKEYLQNNPNANRGIDLQVIVLTPRYWPSAKTCDLYLPSEMVKCVEVFREFYKTKMKDKKLNFNNPLGTCQINGRFDTCVIELFVTTSQAAALMLFNASDTLSFHEIVTQLHLCDDDVKRILHSLSCDRHKILNKEPNTETVSSTDNFEFNSKFTHKSGRVKIPLPHVDEKKVIADVNENRRYVIDALIVRIMKSRKVLGYEGLVEECVEQLWRKFKPDVTLIEQRIEDLITRDYFERDKKNPNLFKYLA